MIGLAAGGLMIATIGAIAYGIFGATTTVLGGVAASKAFALGAAVYNSVAFGIAPLYGIAMQGIEFEQGKNPFFVMLDGVTDVRNFGAIARTCECAAVDAVIIPARGSASVNADAVKTSAGALHTLPVCREQNLRSTLQYLKDSGFRIVAATEKGDYDYTKADYTGPMCIIMGAEDTGVSYDNLALCDEWVKIPMLGSIESLNVSVAAGILIYEGVKQRTN